MSCFWFANNRNHFRLVVLKRSVLKVISCQLAPGTSRRWYSGLNRGLQKDMSIFESLKLVSVTLFGKRVCADVLKLRIFEIRR